jgi:hypothetical protein
MNKNEIQTPEYYLIFISIYYKLRAILIVQYLTTEGAL